VVFFALAPEVLSKIDLDSTLYSGQAFRWRFTERGHCGVLEDDMLFINLTGGGVDLQSAPSGPEYVFPRLASYLRLDDNLAAIQHEIDVDSRVHRAIESYRGLRLLRQDPWECLVAFICSATSNIPRISRTMEAIADAYGSPITLCGERRYTFPSPDRLSDVSESAFRELGMGFRARYLVSAVAIVRRQVDLMRIREYSYEETYPLLLQFPGVGEKIADCVMLFSLEKLRAFPIDRWMRRAISEWYPEVSSCSYRELQEWAFDYFGDYAGYAQMYLFHARRMLGHTEASAIAN
jgi:N-glycosylase/DNA lyase